MLTGLFKYARFGPPQIYTRVFHLWKSVALENAWDVFFSVACFRASRDAPHSRCWCRDLKLCLLDFLKGRFPGTWAIFPSPRNSKLIREDFSFQLNGQRKNF